MTIAIGIAGGSGSGKTTLAEGVAAALPSVAVIPADAYYRDLAHLPADLRARQNFDEPEALDRELLRNHVQHLCSGRAIARPLYDFATHTRTQGTLAVVAAAVVIVEGIFVLALPAVRELLALKIFVDAAEPVRLARRMARDVCERGRTLASVAAQFAGQTRPMHELHIAPTRAHADVIVSGEQAPSLAVATVLDRLAVMTAGKIPA